MTKKSFGLKNNLPLALSLAAVLFSLPLMVTAMASNFFFEYRTKALEEAKTSRAELGTVQYQKDTNTYVLKSTLGRSYKLFSTNLNALPQNFANKDVFAQGSVESVNFYAGKLTAASKMQNNVKSEGVIMDTGDSTLTAEGVYYFSPGDLKAGFFVTSYPDRLTPLVGKKIKAQGSLWSTPALSKPLFNATDIAPL